MDEWEAELLSRAQGAASTSRRVQRMVQIVAKMDVAVSSDDSVTMRDNT